jgi:hypothetical protein
MRNKGRFPPLGRIATTGDHCGVSLSVSSRSANWAMVGARNSEANGSLRPDCFSRAANRRTASSECPPTSKKLSWMPTRSRPSTVAQIVASDFSRGVRGAA